MVEYDSMVTVLLLLASDAVNIPIIKLGFNESHDRWYELQNDITLRIRLLTSKMYWMKNTAP